jgi:protease I
MISAGIMRGRRACAYIGMRDDMANAGADVVDETIVVDDNIVTCAYYGEVSAFMRATITLVAKRGCGASAAIERLPPAGKGSGVTCSDVSRRSRAPQRPAE